MCRFVAVVALVGALALAAAAPQDLVGAGEVGPVGEGGAAAVDEAPAARVAPTPPPAPAPAAAPRPEDDVKEVARSEIINADGSFNYSYELSNGVRVEESGYVKRDPQARVLDAAATEEDNDEVIVAQGSFTYTAPDGTVISVRYTADENGFQPHGDHLPTPHPAIQRALEALAAGDLDSPAGAGAGAGDAQPPQGLTGRSAAGGATAAVVVPDSPPALPSSPAPAIASSPASTSAAPASTSAAPTSTSAAPAVASDAPAEPVPSAAAPEAAPAPDAAAPDATPDADAGSDDVPQ